MTFRTALKRTFEETGGKILSYRPLVHSRATFHGSVHFDRANATHVERTLGVSTHPFSIAFMGYATVRVNAYHINGEMNVTCTERKRQRYRRPTPVVRQRYGNFFLTATVCACKKGFACSTITNTFFSTISFSCHHLLLLDVRVLTTASVFQLVRAQN